MKRIALILLIVIYGLAAFGISIRQFYCCGKLKSTNISFTQEAKQKCGFGDEKSGCCKIKYQTFKVKDSHVVADGVNAPATHFIDLHLFTPRFELAALCIETKSVANSSHAPPLHHNTAIYILNCIYRI